jgi:hypothetical protein
MTSVPRVFTSGDVLASAAGTDVHLLTVETWGDRVVVRMVGALNEAIRADLAGHEARMQDWRERRQAGSDEWPPKLPGELIFQELKVRLADDVGTTFKWSSGSSGGSGTEMLCEWSFEPGMPSAASTLTVTVTSADGSESSRTVRP